MMVKLTQDLARGLKPWKDMFYENEAALNRHSPSGVPFDMKIA